MNQRKLTTELSRDDVAALEGAKDMARAMGQELNTHVTFAPFQTVVDIPSPTTTAAAFAKFLKHTSMWVRRHTGQRLTYLRVVHTDDDGSGRNPHLHMLMHLPSAKHRDELQAAYNDVYDSAGYLVAKVTAGTERRVRHQPSGYFGSSADYITRHKSQQAYVAQGGSTWRASRRDANGRHRGIKTPFVGKRWATSHNIGTKVRAVHDEARVRRITKARVAAERRRLAA